MSRIQKWALRIVYNDKSNFKELLEQDRSFIMNAAFQFGKNSAYELKSDNHLQILNTQLYILAANLLRHYEQKKDKELDTQEFSLLSFRDLDWSSWFCKLTFTFLPGPRTFSTFMTPVNIEYFINIYLFLYFIYTVKIQFIQSSSNRSFSINCKNV